MLEVFERTRTGKILTFSIGERGSGKTNDITDTTLGYYEIIRHDVGQV